jgi:hypothetical protein
MADSRTILRNNLSGTPHPSKKGIDAQEALHHIIGGRHGMQKEAIFRYL